MPIYCPSDTRDTVKQARVSNFALRYQHFLGNEQEGERVKFSIDTMTLGDSQRTIVHLRDRQTNQLNYLAKGHHFFCEFYEVDWRMVIGLGGEHVQETNMTLDYIYGIPYIPGSAFKGVVRGWVIQEDFGNDEKLAMQDIQPGDSADLKEKKKNFLAIFGGAGSAGHVQFLPAYPIDNVTLSLDIMNPHFSDYYTGTSPPTDTQNPKPIKFLTVEQAPFRFVILSKEQHLTKIAEDWVDKALKGKGFGAKTAIGYGYFRRRFPNVPRNFRPNADFQIPLRTRPQRAQQMSLEEAHDQFADPNQTPPDLQLINMALVKNCATQFAQIATRDDFIGLSELDGIHPVLIDQDGDYAMVSDFGKWLWDNLRANILSSRILELPRLTYSTIFRKILKKLPSDELVSVQDELIAISNQLESGTETGSIDVAEHFSYARNLETGTLTFHGYTK